MAAIIQARELRSEHHKLVDVVPLSTPYALFIDICSACNFRCSYCPTGDLPLLKKIGRKAQLMDEDLFIKIVDGLKEFPAKIKRVNLYKDGESTLHPRFCNMVRYLKDANVVDTIWLKTNGSTLLPEFNEKLVNCGLDMIGVSVQGSTAQAFKDIAGVKIDYEEYRANVMDLFERSRGKVKISAKVADYGQSEEEKEKFIRDFRDRCDFIAVEGLHGWSNSGARDWRMGTDNSFDGTSRVYKIACPLTLYMLTINSNGDISICNDDWAHAHQIGNANDVGLVDIWRSERLRDFRIMHLEGRRAENEACNNCDYLMAIPDNIDNDREEILRKIKG